MKSLIKSRIKKLVKERNITGITSDSREVNRGDIFFAITGSHYDGNQYIHDAFQKGASIVFTDNPDKKGRNIEYISNIRMVLAITAEIIYKKLPPNLLAVTGTNGKSSVVSYVHQILSKLNQTSASIGTLGLQSTNHILNTWWSSNHQAYYTTADPITFRKNLTLLHDARIQYVAFEASSHGLLQHRIGKIKVKSAAFTSFSQDHLDYHETMSQYLLAKLILFTKHLASGGEAVINSEIPYINIIRKFLFQKNIPFSTIGKSGDIIITQHQQSLVEQCIVFRYKQQEYKFNTNIIGSFQAINLLIAAKLVHNLGFNFNKIVDKLPELIAATGRLHRITSTNSVYQVFVDYAHTPDAIQQSLRELKKIKNKLGSLYVIFGCGGNRDILKRPIMGRMASDIADRVIITDDNPRTEDPKKIRQEILVAAPRAKEIEDRQHAIITTIAKLKPYDVLLIAGKGHEEYQIIGNKKLRCSDIEIAAQAIKENTK